MTISSIPSVALPTTSTSSGGATGTLGDQLLAALSQAQAGGGVDPLLQTLVTLSSGNGATSTGTAPLTYNAQGLLNQVQSATLLNDPLLQTSAAGSAGAFGGIDTSQLSSLLALGQSGGSASGAAGTPDSNTGWAQLLQKDPALAATYVETQAEQNLIGMLP